MHQLAQALWNVHPPPFPAPPPGHAAGRPLADVATALARTCGMLACGQQIPYCQPTVVFKHNGKVRRTLGWTPDGRLRLGEVVSDKERCLVCFHYSHLHENASYVCY